MRVGFGLSDVEAILAVVVATSLAIGPAIQINYPLGRILPISLQILIQTETGSNFPAAVDAICQRVNQVFLAQFGRSIYRGKTAAAQAPSNGHSQSTVVPDQIEQALAEHRRKRQSGLFPIGDIIDGPFVSKLVSECADVAFGSVSENEALRHFMQIAGRERLTVDRFINAGWSGHTVAGAQLHPVFPTINLVWAATQADVACAIETDLLKRVPGLLLAVPPIVDNTICAEPTPLPYVLKTWREHILEIAEEYRLTFMPRHIVVGPNIRANFSDESGSRLLRSCKYATQYSVPGCDTFSLLERAPLQIAKIAAILNSGIRDIINPIPTLYVEIAEEIYRWLVRGTISALENRTNAKPDRLTLDIKKIVNNLQLRGPLTLREITRTFDRQDTLRVSTALIGAKEQGLISEEAKRFKAIQHDDSGERRQCVSASVASSEEKMVFSVVPK
jgi:hypothetical protein